MNTVLLVNYISVKLGDKENNNFKVFFKVSGNKTKNFLLQSNVMYMCVCESGMKKTQMFLSKSPQATKIKNKL